MKGTNPEETAVITFRWLSEQGAIEMPGLCLQVVKPSAYRGTWRFEQEGTVWAVARKTSPFRRRFEILMEKQSAVLEAESAFGRAMRLTTPNGGGRIAPRHSFTRRATMEMTGVPFALQCMAFWLTVLTWRRSAESSTPAS